MTVSEARPIDHIVAQGYRVRIWEYFREGWCVFWRWPLGFFGVMVAAGAIDEVFLFLFPVLSLTGPVVQEIIGVGVALVCWRLLRANTTGVSDFVPDLRTVLRLIGYSIIVGLVFIAVMIVGSALVVRGKMALLLLVGAALVYFLTLIIFVPMVIAERYVGIVEGFKVSMRIVSRNWWGVVSLCAAELVVVMGPYLILYLLPDTVLDVWFSGIFPTFTTGEIRFLQAWGEPYAFWGQGAEQNLGSMIVVDVTVGFSLAIFWCILAVAYADIFGLRGVERQDASGRV